MTTGRPTDYCKEIADQILVRIMERQGVAEIGRDPTMPAERTIFGWLAKHDEFMQRYVRAKEFSADMMEEDMLDIADNATNDYMLRINNDGDQYVEIDKEHIQRSKLRIDTRKWLMSKLKPKKYGDRIHQEVTGPDGQPIRHSIETIKSSDAKKMIEELQKS